MCDWNKYIFHTDNSNDMEEMEIQKDCDVFDAFSSAAIAYFESCNVNKNLKSKTRQTDSVI